jgi:hypothetical protein
MTDGFLDQPPTGNFPPSWHNSLRQGVLVDV